MFLTNYLTIFILFGTIFLSSFYGDRRKVPVIAPYTSRALLLPKTNKQTKKMQIGGEILWNVEQLEIQRVEFPVNVYSFNFILNLSI